MLENNLKAMMKFHMSDCRYFPKTAECANTSLYPVWNMRGYIFSRVLLKAMIMQDLNKKLLAL